MPSSSGDGPQGARAGRLVWVDMAKGGSILLVVLFHAAIALEEIDLVASVWWRLNDAVAPIRMPLFFLVSGLLSAKALGLPWPDFWSRRLLPLVWAFAVWSVLHLVLGPLLSGRALPDPTRFLAIPFAPVSVIWFLWALVAYAVLARAVSGALRPAVLAAVVALALASHLGAFELSRFAHENLMRFTPFFLVGAWYAERVVRVVAAYASRVALPVTLVYGLVLVFADVFGDTITGLAGFALSWIGVVVGFSAARLLERVGPIARGLSALGRNTLQIYVVHTLALAAMAHAVAPFVAGSEPPGIVALVGVPVAAGLSIGVGLAAKRLADALGARILFSPPRRSPPERAARS